MPDFAFSEQIFEKSSNMKFLENPSSWSRIVPRGRSDMTKLVVAFRNFPNAPTNGNNYTIETTVLPWYLAQSMKYLL